MNIKASIAICLTLTCGTLRAHVDQAATVLVMDYGLPDGSGSCVEKFDVQGRYLGSFASPDLQGTAPGAVDKDGHCWVPSFASGKIVCFDPGRLVQTGAIDVGGNPIAVDFDSDGKLLVVKFNDGTIERWTPFGEKLSTVVTGLQGPDSIRVSGRKIIVGQRHGKGYAVFEAESWKPLAGSPFNAIDSLTSAAEGIVLGPDRNSDTVPDIYIADRRTFDGSNDLSGVAVYSGADNLLIDARMVTGLYSPLGLAVLPGGDLLIVDNGRAGEAETGSIKRWNGRELSDFTTQRATGWRWNGLIVIPGSTAASGVNPADLEFFEKQVRPLLARRCWECHGRDKQESELRLDSLAGVRLGGDSGPPVVPGKPEESLLIQAIRYAAAGDLQMPPTGKLPETEVATLVRWVESGAVWPPEESQPAPAEPTKTGLLFNPQQKAHWAFQKIADPHPPEVIHRDWLKSPLDAFILSKLEKQEWKPAPPAEKHTLLRRLTFDLTGLPPTSEEIAAFLDDNSPEAFAKVVDRLLASPRYGERWGRHWLDLVRYAETTASDGNFVMETAYRYRDYVIQAFNEDKPYDQFIVEQLAGDLLPDGGDSSLAVQRAVATGFLMLGPKALAEADKEQVIMDVVDEQIDVTSRVLLGLTAACARCHDHKFDPIPTADYYSLAGIFRSTTSVIDLDQQTSRWHERSLPGPDGQPVSALAPGERHGHNLRIHVRGSHFNLGAEVPRRFPQIIAGEEQPGLQTAQSGRLELARWIASRENPLTARVMVNRIWQGHFGVGLVRTSDDFGMHGEPPSHPELLDWLSTRLIESGWSIKALNRTILLSSTYRMSTAFNAQAAQIDPENRLLSHMNRRRLEAEEIRDSVLAVSGQLDLTMGGSSIEAIYQQGDVVDPKRRIVSASKLSADFPGFENSRRSIYLPVVRNMLPDLLTLFDAASANAVTAVRDETTVPSQALLMLNNPWVRERALNFARRLLALAGTDDRQRIEYAYVNAIGRPPTEDEISEAIAYLQQYVAAASRAGRDSQASHEAAWQSLCHTLFCLNRFIYVD